MAVTLETITPPQSGPLNIEIKLSANIQITPETARRRVGVFVGNEIADLLHGDIPDLVLREDGVYWRVPVMLSSRSMGWIGQVGAIDVDVDLFGQAACHGFAIFVHDGPRCSGAQCQQSTHHQEHTGEQNPGYDQQHTCQPPHE